LKLIITSPFGLTMDERGDHTSARPQRKFATDPPQLMEISRGDHAVCQQFSNAFEGRLA
jgi:hypothetical protein